MTVSALISGQAGLALVEGREAHLRTTEGRHLSADDHASLLRAFDGATDVRRARASSLDEIDALLKTAWSSDRALQLLLLLLDPTEDDAERREYAECVEELLVDDAVRSFVVNRLFAAPLPPEAIRVGLPLEHCEFTSSLLDELHQHQPQITTVATAFESSSPNGTSEREKDLARQALINAGAFYEAVFAIDSPKDLPFLRLRILHGVRGHAELIANWFAALDPSGPRQFSRKDYALLDEIEEEDDDWTGEARGSSFQVFENVKAQQAQITQKLRIRDLVAARRLTQALVQEQRLNSTSEQIAKTLCKLAMQAKAQEVPELQLEWAEAATLENPIDPKTYGHLADALIGLGRYADAEVALQKVADAGDNLYAESRRASILKYIGQPLEARERFLELMKEYEGAPQIEFTHIAAAEVLKDLGRMDEAIAEFQGITERWPLEPRGWEGLATALLDSGDLDGALKNYGRAASNSRNAVSRARPQNGRARALRLVGRFEEARSLYDEVISAFPNNEEALTGRAEVLRLAGKLGSALEAFEVALERCPASALPIAGKAEVLRDLRRLADAEALYVSGQRKFPYDQRLAAGYAAILRSQGRYEAALSATDAGITRFPFNATLPNIRADLLDRLGRTNEAIEAYKHLQSSRPYHPAPRVGLAKLLLRVGQLDEADTLLHDGRARTQGEWTQYLLRSFLIQKRSGSASAVRHLERGIEHCPFATQRRLLRSALAKIELERGRSREARRVVEDAPEEVSDVIALHVLAVTHRSGMARKRYKQVVDAGGPAEVIELANEIARRHSLVSGAPRREESWIREREQQLLFQEAA